MDSVKDHLGNEYNTVYEMCGHYNIGVQTYYKRIQRGYTLKEALEKPVRIRKDIDSIIDHIGNKYESIAEMCEHYNVNVKTYYNRLNHGCTLEYALTKNDKKDIDDVEDTEDIKKTGLDKSIDTFFYVFEQLLENDFSDEEAKKFIDEQFAKINENKEQCD